MGQSSLQDGSDDEAFFNRVRELCPSFVSLDDDGAKDWQDEGRNLGYIRISALARHLTQLAEQRQWRQVKVVLDDAEDTLTSADGYTRELMVVGLLEDLQNDCLRTDGRVRLVDVRALLGPSSKTAWDDLMRFWHGPESSSQASSAGFSAGRGLNHVGLGRPDVVPRSSRRPPAPRPSAEGANRTRLFLRPPSVRTSES